MASDKKDEHCEPPNPPTRFPVSGKGDDSTRGLSSHDKRCKKPNMAALIITAISLALLLAAVIVIGTTQATSDDQAGKNTTTAGPPGLPPSPPSTEPPGGDQGLSWCQVRGDGNCTLGVYQNLDSGQIRAQVFDHTCRALGSSDHIQLEAATALNSSLPDTLVLLIHGVTGPTDEFWYNGTHHSDGWFWQNPVPVWYETQSFACL